MKFEKLGNILYIQKGKKNEIAESISKTSVRLIQIDDLRNDNNIKYTNDQNGIFVDVDDLMIVWDGANAGTIGYGKKGYIGSTIAALKKNKPDECSTEYLGLFLKTKFNYFQKNSTGATIPHIDRRTLEELKIPLPPLPDQIKIATVLSKAEALIQKKKENISLLDEFLKSSFLKMFGDPVKNEKGWEKKPLKSFGDIITGNTPPRNDLKNYSEKYIEWIKTDNIKNDSLIISQADEYLSEIGLKKSRFVDKGALLVACIAGSLDSIGRACLTDRKVAFNQQINAIQPNKEINSLFLYHLFKISIRYIQNHTTKGMKKILTKGEFEKIIMIKPPLPLQNEFAAIVEKTEALKEKLKSSLVDLENLYGALSQKAFKGELDLSKMEIDSALLPVSQEIIPTENKNTKDKIESHKKTDKVSNKKPERKTKKSSIDSLLDWGKVSSKQIADWIQEEFEDYHFNSEMLTNYLLKEKVNSFDYFTSEELLKNPKVTGSEDLKSLVFTAIAGENPFLKLEQFFYNAEDNNKNLLLRDEDYKLIQKKSKEERSGIYFQIIK